MAEKKRDIIVLTVREESEGGGHGGSWKVAYADFVTALMALFLLLWLVMALKPQQKAGLAQFFKDPKDLAKVKLAVETGAPARVIKVHVVDEAKLTNRDQIQRDIQTRLKEWVTKDMARIHSVDVLAEDRGVLIYVNNSLLFEPGATKLKQEVRELLQQVAEIMKTHNLDLEIRGHADDSEQLDARYDNKWTLSGVRAMQAKRLLCDTQGISYQRVEAIGYGDSQPLFPVNKPGNKDKNRRLEFYFYVPVGESPPPPEAMQGGSQQPAPAPAQPETGPEQPATAPMPEQPASPQAGPQPQAPPSAQPANPAAEPQAQSPPPVQPSADNAPAPAPDAAGPGP